MSTGKHLSLDKRIVIESSLNEQVSLKEISRRIGVAPSTVSREIRSHLIFRNTGAHNRSFNSCSKRKNCHITMVCSRCDYQVDSAQHAASVTAYALNMRKKYVTLWQSHLTSVTAANQGSGVHLQKGSTVPQLPTRKRMNSIQSHIQASTLQRKR